MSRQYRWAPAIAKTKHVITAQVRGEVEALPRAIATRFWRFGTSLLEVVALEAFGFEPTSSTVIPFICG